MSTAVVALGPRAATGGPRRRQPREVTRDWWEECKRIMAEACPLIVRPTPVREALPAI
ncbi:MAG TPA: hypothetical protein VKD47_02340 [Miltoncostaeaceae bacterium]|nr:hypothetical protein [Miltoncostaeaceae bacterium]